MKLEILKKSGIETNLDYVEAEKVASALMKDWNDPLVVSQIKTKHVVGGESQDIQAILLPAATKEGFESEKNGLFKTYKLRPDYYRNISPNLGILIEIERGKTLDNNMDMLDIWKCHICPYANYLFLVVPMSRPTRKGTHNKIFDSVLKRARSFFYNENHVHIDAIFIFGY